MQRYRASVCASLVAALPTLRRSQATPSPSPTQTVGFALTTASRAVSHTVPLLHSTNKHFRPFSSEDEAQLTSVLSSKPRHVARHIRQSMLHSQRRITQFRNSVTYLMILLQSRLQKKEIDPADASLIMESVMKECVELRQGDMAHLLFRAAIRFRKYGVTVNVPFVKHLYDSYRHENAQELMRNMADELKSDPSLRLLAVIAYQFCGQHADARELLGSMSLADLSTADACSLLESLGATGQFDDLRAMVSELVRTAGGGAVTLDVDALFSTALIAARGDSELFESLLHEAVHKRRCRLSEAAVAVVLRLRMEAARPRTVAEVYDVERHVRDELRLQALGMMAETAVIAKCTEIVSRSNEAGDAVMLDKVNHLRFVVDAAIDNDQLDDMDATYVLALIKGYGVLGKFDEMRTVFNKIRDAGGLKDHRLYDEMLKWYAHAFNLKEVIALKEEMTRENIFHTPNTYFNVFKVLDKYYPRMVEKYLSEMRSRGINIEPFMYPTLIRVFSELRDSHTVNTLYNEALSKATRGGRFSLSPSVIVQMLKCYAHDAERCAEVIRDAEQHGLLTHEMVQAEIVQFYSMNERQEELRSFLSRIPERSQNMYRVLLRDAAKRKDRRAFDALLSDLTRSGVEVNERIFSVVITALSHFHDAEAVRLYMHRALASDQIRTPLFFADSAAAYARLGEPGEVDRCWQDLLASKMVITMPVYNRFLDLYMAQNNLSMVQEILNTMMRLVPPNPVTATTVVDMLGKMGRLDEMEAVLGEMMKSTNAVPTLVTYHQAMNAYAKAGDVVKMEAIRDQLRREGLKENAVTYNILFEGYGRAKRYEHIHELQSERADKGIPMEEFGYVILLNLYSRARMTTETQALVESMVQSGTKFSSRMLATVATAFSAVGEVQQMEHYISLLLSHPDCRVKDVESVFLIYSRMRDTVKLQELLDTEKLPKNEFVYNICVSAFAKAGEHAKVAYLLTKMEDKGYTLTRSTSVTLSSLLLKAGKMELAQTVLKWKGMTPTNTAEPADEPSELDSVLTADNLADEDEALLPDVGEDETADLRIVDDPLESPQQPKRAPPRAKRRALRED